VTDQPRLKLLFISGPNLQLLGTREPGVYGSETLEMLYERAWARALELNAEVDGRQTNHEGTIVDWIGESHGFFDGILLNPGAYTHTSIAIHDAIAGARVVAAGDAVVVTASTPLARLRMMARRLKLLGEMRKLARDVAPTPDAPPAP
jgi:3-dehydroquinate dehydratase